MANKLNFLPEEWATLLESTTVAGIAVSAAEPSGLWGTLKEFLASSSALDAAKRDPHSNELVAAVIAELETEARAEQAPQGAAQALCRGEESG